MRTLLWEFGKPKSFCTGTHLSLLGFCNEQLIIVQPVNGDWCCNSCWSASTRWVLLWHEAWIDSLQRIKQRLTLHFLERWLLLQQIWIINNLFWIQVSIYKAWMIFLSIRKCKQFMHAVLQECLKSNKEGSCWSIHWTFARQVFSVICEACNEFNYSLFVIAIHHNNSKTRYLPFKISLCFIAFEGLVHDVQETWVTKVSIEAKYLFVTGRLLLVTLHKYWKSRYCLYQPNLFCMIKLWCEVNTSW